MKRFFIATSIIATSLLFLTPQKTFAQTETGRYIDISTTVEREVSPNELYLQITIREKDYKGKKNLEEMQEALIGALKVNRIDVPECLTLNYMGSEISYKSFSKNIKAQTEATYMLRLNDVTTMQNVISALEERQISDIELVRTKYTGEKELKEEMGIEAMQLAKAEAQMLAGAIGQEAGKAITISYWMNSGQTQPRLYKARMSNIAEDSAVDNASNAPIISIGKNTYRFTVNVRFELK
ncbi:MAG: SIMPL domain-containing protein [Bacteroidaceae bacterium]|nr:SIMPL domain-containing protein [Bacteroidaceae bacterium]